MSEQPVSPADAPTWDVADRMRKALREADLSVASMADYLGVSDRSARNWISGRIDPSTQTLRLWALHCGVPFSWLANGDTTGPTTGGEELFDQFRRGSSRRSLDPRKYTCFTLIPPMPLTRELAA